MKNVLANFLKPITALLLVSFLFTVTSCESDDNPEKYDDGITAQDIERMIDAHIIEPTKAIDDYQKYSSDRVEQLNGVLGDLYQDPDFRDTRAIWFDIKSIKAYIKHLEEESGGFDGLQFYFTVNSDGGEDKNHQTLMIAPTRNINGVQSGFTIVDGEIRYLNQLFDVNAVKPRLKLDNSERGFIFNEGNASPPNNNN